jgi:hypothetical protein
MISFIDKLQQLKLNTQIPKKPYLKKKYSPMWYWDCIVRKLERSIGMEHWKADQKHIQEDLLEQ